MALNVFPLSVVLTAVDNLSGPLGKVGGRLGAFGKNASRVGRQLTLGLTLPLLAVGGASLKIASDFEAATIELQAIGDIGSASLNRLTQSAEELGKTTQFTAAQVVQNQINLTRAGLDVNEVLAAQGGVLEIATAGNLELAEAAKISAAALRGSATDAKDFAQIVAVLTNASVNANIEIGEIAEGLSKSSAAFTSIGIPISENVALLASMADAGIDASVAGTALKRATQELIVPTSRVSKALQALGISTANILPVAEDGSRSLFDLLEHIEGVTGGGINMARAFTIIFGKRAGPNVLAAFTAEGSEGIRDLESKLGNLETGTRIFEARMLGLAGGLKQMKSAAEGLAISIGKSGLLKEFTSLMAKLTGVFRWLGDLDPAVLSLGVQFGVLLAAMGPISFAVGKMALLWKGATIAVGFFGTALTALMAHPVVAITVGIGALLLLVFQLIENWEAVADAARFAGKALVEGVGSALDWVWRKLKQLAGIILPTWLENLIGLQADSGGAVFGAGFDQSGNFGRGFFEAKGANIGGNSDPIAAAQGEGGKGGEVRVIVEGPPGTRVESEGVSAELGLSMAGA